MDSAKYALVIVTCALCAVIYSDARAEVHSKIVACSLLKREAVRYHFVQYGNPPGAYHCYVDWLTAGYFIAGLHYIVSLQYRKSHGDMGHPESTLVGWYAVRRRDGKIFDWDLANQEVGQPIPESQ
jgi:hypothetical protein